MTPLIFWIMLMPFPNYTGPDGGYVANRIESKWSVCKELDSEPTAKVYEIEIDANGLKKKEVTFSCGAITKQDK